MATLSNTADNFSRPCRVAQFCGRRATTFASTAAGRSFRDDGFHRIAGAKRPRADGAVVSLETLDRAPPGWFVVTLTRAKSRGWYWVALMVNVDPDEMKNCSFFRDSVSFL